MNIWDVNQKIWAKTREVKEARGNRDLSAGGPPIRNQARVPLGSWRKRDSGVTLASRAHVLGLSAKHVFWDAVMMVQMLI